MDSFLTQVLSKPWVGCQHCRNEHYLPYMELLGGKGTEVKNVFIGSGL